jgi:hypothetical protein
MCPLLGNFYDWLIKQLNYVHYVALDEATL